jgi:hypothetical protein
MAKKKTRKAAPPLSLAHKKRFMTQLQAAEDSIKTLNASVKTLRAVAAATHFHGAMPLVGKRRRRSRRG